MTPSETRKFNRFVAPLLPATKGQEVMPWTIVGPTGSRETVGLTLPVAIAVEAKFTGLGWTITARECAAQARERKRWEDAGISTR